MVVVSDNCGTFILISFRTIEEKINVGGNLVSVRLEEAFYMWHLVLWLEITDMFTLTLFVEG